MLLKKGSKGEDVKSLQIQLNSYGNYGLTADGIFGDKTLAAVKDFQSKNNLTVDGIVGQKTNAALYKSQNSTPSGVKPSQMVIPSNVNPTPMMVPQTAKPSTNTGTTTTTPKPTVTTPSGATTLTTSKSYAEMVNTTLQQILDRKPMQYDYNGDPLYQMYKDAAMKNSQIASKDAMARAAALTGGYGNSYAATVANQTAQQQMAGLNEKIPELEQIARARYEAETSRLTDKLNILSALEDQAYTRKWNEEERRYEREADAYDRLKSEEQYLDSRNDLEWDRKYALAQLAANYGDLSGLKKLGVDTSKYNPNVTTGTVGSTGKPDTWTYDELSAYFKENPISEADTTVKSNWATHVLDSFLRGNLTENQAITLATLNGFSEQFWAMYNEYKSKYGLK